MKETYTHGHAEAVLRSHRWRTAENSAAYLLPHLRADLRLIDVGCGPGTITVDLAGRVAATIGIDASAEVVAEAAASAGDRPDVTFRVGDAYAPDVEPGSIDVVHAHQVLQHLADPVAALAAWRAVLAPGGLLAVRDSDYGAFAWTPADPRLDRWLEVYATVARGNGGEPDAGRHLVAWVRRAGFDDVTPTASAWCFAAEGDRRWWGGLWADRCRTSTFARQAVATGVCEAGELDEMADAWTAWAAHPDACILVPHGEVLARV